MKNSIHIQSVAEGESLLGADGTSAGVRFAALVGSLLQAIMAIALLILLFFLIWGAFDWLTSAGEKGKLEAARNKMVNAVIGILLLASSIAIFLFVQYFLGLTVLNFNFAGSSSGSTTAGYICQPYSNLCPAGTRRVANDSCGASCTLPSSVCCGP